MISPQLARIRSFEVVPALPEPLNPLLDIAYNLWWSWHPEAVELFKRLDRELWDECGRNPVKMLGMIDQPALDRAAEDRSFLHALSLVHGRLISHVGRSSWFERKHHELCEGEGPFVWRTSPRSSASPTACRSTRAAWGAWRGTTSNRRASWGCRSAGSGCSTRTGTSTSTSTPTGGSRRRTRTIDFENQPLKPCARRFDGRAAARARRACPGGRGGGHLGAARRACPDVSARHQPAREHRRGPRDHADALRRGHGPPDQAGDRPGHRRRACAGGGG